MAHHDRTLIEDLARVEPGSPVATAFAARAEARRNAEESYRLLLHPAQAGSVSLVERRSIALFVAALHTEPQTLDHYDRLLRTTDPTLARLANILRNEADAAATAGPYGRFPEGPLSVEDLDGPVYRVSPAVRSDLGDRISAALEHAHLLVLHPRDADQEALERLIAAGWTTSGIVILSQLVAFLSFQIRVVAGLHAYVLAREDQIATAK